MVANRTDYPRTTPVLEVLSPTVPEFGYTTWSPAGSFPAITDSSDASLKQVRAILAGVEALYMDTSNPRTEVFGLPARVELFWYRERQELRGLAIFDTEERLIVHVAHALLGYSGSGPILTREILKLLGVSKEMFEKLQRAAWDQNYLIILSRERPAPYEGLDNPQLDVEPEWTWWIAHEHLDKLLP